MSLYKQLWLAITCLMFLVFGATFLVTSFSARQYLEHQLYMKNVDNASTLALSIDLQGKDPAARHATLAAQFDEGHYELIELQDATGKTLERWQDHWVNPPVPLWFLELVSIDVEPGITQLRAGGEILTLRSQVSFAYETLWSNTQQLAAIFLLAVLVAGALGNLLLKMILKPLNDVVAQAGAIGERRFITVAEPAALELKLVSRAMNTLSRRVKSMLQQESTRLEKWQQEVHVDEVTGVLNREHFLQLFGSTLNADDADTSGVLTLIRISDLAILNQVHGREAVDSILAGFGATLSQLKSDNKGIAMGRLNGADFALLSPRELDPGAIGKNLQQALREVLIARGLGQEIKLPGATTTYTQGDSPGQLLGNLDSALLNAEKQGNSEMVTMGRDGIQMMPVRQELKRWRSMLHHAFSEGKFSLASYPVTTLQGVELHHEAPVRLHWRSSTLTAGQILPWINRLDLADELDRQVINLALIQIRKNRVPISVTLSSAAVASAGFLPWLSDRLSSHPDAANLLWLEVQEAAAYRHLTNFKRLCSRCKRYGTQVGIEHLGHQLTDIGRLHDVGVDYVKVDSAFIRDVDSNPANQTLLRMLCTLVHSLGITAIAEGVESRQEWDALEGLGFDAATGPQVTLLNQESAVHELALVDACA